MCFDQTVVHSLAKPKFPSMPVTGLYFTYPRDRQAALRAAEKVAARRVPSSSSAQSDSASLRERSTSLVSVSLLGSKSLL